MIKCLLLSGKLRNSVHSVDDSGRHVDNPSSVPGRPLRMGRGGPPFPIIEERTSHQSPTYDEEQPRNDMAQGDQRIPKVSIAQTGESET